MAAGAWDLEEDARCFDQGFSLSDWISKDGEDGARPRAASNREIFLTLRRLMKEDNMPGQQEGGGWETRGRWKTGRRIDGRHLGELAEDETDRMRVAVLLRSFHHMIPQALSVSCDAAIFGSLSTSPSDLNSSSHPFVFG